MAKLCNKGCGVEITLSDKTGKWLPYDANGEIHRCPKKEAQKVEPKKTDSYYSGIRKVAELTLEEANKQLEDKRWEILKVVEKTSLNLQQSSGVAIPLTTTVIIFVLGMRE